MEFMQIAPQKARGVLKESMWTDPKYIIEEKWDGIRELSQFIGHVARFTGRRESVKGGLSERSANLPHLSNVGCPPEWVDPKVWLLDGTVLDGEILLDPVHLLKVRAKGGGLSKAVGSILNCLPPESLRKMKERGFLRYAVFDCLWFKGEDIRHRPLLYRRMKAEEAVKEWANPYVFMSKAALHANKKDFLESILNEGGEGIILKHIDAPYGKQTKWIKFKAEWNADTVVTGYKNAREMSLKKGDDEETMTKYAAAGLIGAIRVSQYRDGQLWECATISGMDEELRTELSRNGQAYLMKVCEIVHNGREPTGKFRHPRISPNGFRTDKSSTECVYRKDEI